MAACGAIETILTLYMMQDGFIAPTLNLEQVDERCNGIRHVRELVEAPFDMAAIQNFAFGGVNTCLILKKWADV
jgi:3-oxoacyl-[acyl-carrier-protein] synthase II